MKGDYCIDSKIITSIQLKKFLFGLIIKCLFTNEIQLIFIQTKIFKP